MKIVEYVKSHPYMTGAIVIGGVVVFVLLSGMGGSVTSAGNTDTGPSPEEVQAAAGVQIAQAQAQGVAAQATAQREIAKYEHDLGIVGVTAARDTAYNDALGAVAEHYLDNRGSVQISALENPLNYSSGKSGGFKIGFKGFSLGASGGSNHTNQTTQQFSWPSIDEVLGAFSKNSSVVLGATPPTAAQSQV